MKNAKNEAEVRIKFRPATVILFGMSLHFADFHLSGTLSHMSGDVMWTLYSVVGRCEATLILSYLH